MPNTSKLYLPCPCCGRYGPKTFNLIPKSGIENADPQNISQWHLVCVHCGTEINQKKAIKKFINSGGKYKPIKD